LVRHDVENSHFSINFPKTAHSVTTVTAQFGDAPYILYRTTGDGPHQKGVEIMSWQSSAKLTIDCVAITAGLLMASPFFLILASPFLITY